MTHKVNHPAKVLSGTSVSASTLDEWPYDDGLGDLWWEGGSMPKSYRWSVDITIDIITHGSHLTRKPFEYNGLDLTAGDWIGDATSGVSCQIISVTSKTETTATVVVEDILRYNTFRSATGDGLFNVPGTIVAFATNELGEPVLDPLPAGLISTDFVGNIQSRFSAFALQENFQLEQTAHGFDEGDAIAIDPSTMDFEKADTNSLEYLIGTVGSDGPGPNAFLLKPTTRIIENHEPAFPGSKGSFIYADPSSPGELTTTKTARKAFLQLTDAVPSCALGTVALPTTTIGFEMVINGIVVTFTGTSLTDAVSDINSAMTVAGSSVVASDPFAPTVASSSLALFYGLVAAKDSPPGGTVTTASINGVSVVFDDLTDGTAAFAIDVAIQSDMARDINAAVVANAPSAIDDIVATSDATDLIITDAVGASITLVNITSDSDAVPFAGASSCSGIPLVTAATTDQFLKLSSTDGGEIILQNEIGDPLGDFGLVSVDNGRLPVGLIIEQGIRRGDLFVVADITERDALTVLTGDQAYVLNKDDGEWGMFLWTGSVWSKTATEESARVDSDSISITVDFDDTPSPFFIATVNGFNGRTGSGSRISLVSIEVITPFDGAPTITIGDGTINDRLFTDTLVDLTSVGNYVHTPTHNYTSVSDTAIRAYYTQGGASAGQMIITITYS